MSITVRKFNTPFSIKLNAFFAEDETHGFEANYLRFMFFLDDLNEKIEEINQRTREKLKNEEAEFAHYLLKRPDIDSQQNHFPSMLTRGLVISMYSYLDNQTSAIKKLCKESGVWAKTNPIPPRKKEKQRPEFYLKVECIYNRMLQKELNDNEISENLSELMSWTKVRNDLVHDNGKANSAGREFLDRNGITVSDKSISISKEGALRLNKLIYDFLTEIVEEINVKHDLVTRTPSN